MLFFFNYILQAGLGGARDATNIISSSGLVASVITTIGEEHLAALGGSLETIAMATKRKNTTPSLSIGHMESHQHTSSSYHNNFLTTFKHWWGSTFNTSKWLMQPFSSFIAWSISGLILRKRSFNNFADTGWPDFPSKMRSRMVRICGLLEKNKACCPWCAKL